MALPSPVLRFPVLAFSATLPQSYGVSTVRSRPVLECMAARGPLPFLPWGPGPGEGPSAGAVAVADCSLSPQASLMANCQAPCRPWLASHMSTVFLTLLCFPSFLGAAIFICYAVWQ